MRARTASKRFPAFGTATRCSGCSAAVRNQVGIVLAAQLQELLRVPRETCQFLKDAAGDVAVCDVAEHSLRLGMLLDGLPETASSR